MSDQPVVTEHSAVEQGTVTVSPSPKRESALMATAMSHEVNDSAKVMRLQSLGVRFGDKLAVRDVSFDVLENCVVALIGPSGSGKTTVLRALNRLHDLTPGSKVEGQVAQPGGHGIPTAQPVPHHEHLPERGVGIAFCRR
jgi:ABC-type glutathione transport system ATPase component